MSKIRSAASLAVQAYAQAVRDEEQATKDRRAACDREEKARDQRQKLWSEVDRLRNEGKCDPGVYRVGRGLHEEGMLITEGNTVPGVFPMWEALND